MSRTLESTPQLRAKAALAEARKARHHKDCHCQQFDRRYCNAVDALLSNRIDRELDAISAQSAKAPHSASDLPGQLPGSLQL